MLCWYEAWWLDRLSFQLDSDIETMYIVQRDTSLSQISTNFFQIFSCCVEADSHRQSLDNAILPCTCYTWTTGLLRWVEWVDAIFHFQNSRYDTQERPTSLSMAERDSSPLFTWTTWRRSASVTLERLGILQHWLGQWSKVVMWPCYQLLPGIISRQYRKLPKNTTITRAFSYFDEVVFINLHTFSNYEHVLNV